MLQKGPKSLCFKKATCATFKENKIQRADTQAIFKYLFLEKGPEHKSVVILSTRITKPPLPPSVIKRRQKTPSNCRRDLKSSIEIGTCDENDVQMDTAPRA